MTQQRHSLYALLATAMLLSGALVGIMFAPSASGEEHDINGSVLADGTWLVGATVTAFNTADGDVTNSTTDRCCCYPVNGDKTLAIPDPGIPIVRLDEGQAILIYARAIIGLGFQHAKWQAVVAPRFHEAQTLRLSGKRSKELVEASEANDFQKSGKTLLLKDPIKAYHAIRKLRQFHTDEDAQAAIKIETLPDHYIFEFETTGATTARLALEQALKALDSHCAEFVAGLEAAA